MSVLSKETQQIIETVEKYFEDPSKKGFELNTIGRR